MIGALLSVLLILQTSRGTQLAGYDCGDQLTNLTTISLLDVGECDVQRPELNITQQYIQLLQANEFTKTQVIQCSIKITRHITHCGMHSHASRVLDGEISYYQEVGREECIRMFKNGYTNIAGTIINNLPKNSTFSTPIVFAGSIDLDGKCTGTSYADPYGRWHNVLVQGYVEITISNYYATVNLNANKIQLRTGTSCQLTDTRCRDTVEGYAFWEPLPEDSCGHQKHLILYEGYVNRTREYQSERVTYMLETRDITFALASIGEIKLCGYTLIRTEHPKLFILENFEEKSFVPKKDAPIENLDIFTYVNSKFVYVERHFKNQISQMYYDLLKHKCELERQVLINALSIATQSPDEFAYRLMKEPGHMAVVAGEVVHLVKCLQVEVRRRDTTECYHQLPVYRGEEPFFLSPRTRILTRAGTQISCSGAMPPMFKAGSSWLQFLPAPSSIVDPEVLKPQTKRTWEYATPRSMAVSGIYTEADLDGIRDHIMFPLERSSVLNNVAMGMTGKSIQGKGISINQFLDSEILESLANNTWDRMWGKFLTFGTASAAIIGFIMLARLIKLLVDTIIHGYAIYSIYGFSAHLLGAVWNSVTQLLLHLGNRRRQPEPQAQQKFEKDKERQPNLDAHFYDNVEGRSEGSLNHQPSDTPRDPNRRSV